MLNLDCASRVQTPGVWSTWTQTGVLNSKSFDTRGCLFGDVNPLAALLLSALENLYQQQPHCLTSPLQRCPFSPYLTSRF